MSIDMRIKRQEKSKINKNEIKERKDNFCIQYPFFSFRFLTTNSNHNWNYFKDTADYHKTLTSFTNRLEDISRENWLYWSHQGKENGIEAIDYSRMRFQASITDEHKRQLGFTKDTKVMVFRFDTFQGNGRGRIMGFKSTPCSAFYIIGFDFDFSAYNHGR